MESNNAPVHDFAPAWLKIPSFTANKPPPASSTTTSTSTTSNTIVSPVNEDIFDLRPQYLRNPQPLTRGRDLIGPWSSTEINRGNLDNGKESTSRPSSINSGRHHSSGDLDSSPDSIKQLNLNRRYSKPNSAATGGVGGGVGISVIGSNKWDSLSSSSSSSGSGGVSGQRSRPSSRHEQNFRDITSFHHSKPTGHNSYGSEGSKPSLLLSSSYHHHLSSAANSHQHHHHSNTNSNHIFNSDQSAIDGAKNSSNKASNTSVSNRGVIDSNTFNQEFPSLVDEKSTGQLSGNGNSVWDNAKAKVVLSTGVSRKVTLLPRPAVSSTSNTGSGGSADNSTLQEDKLSVDGLNGGSSFYRNLVPVSKKRSNPLNSKETLGLISSLGHNAKILPVLTKSTLQMSSSPTMKTLVKNPVKKRSNKNEFLKTLRSDSNVSMESGNKNEEGNGTTIASDVNNKQQQQLDQDNNDESLKTSVNNLDKVNTEAKINSGNNREECEKGIKISKLVISEGSRNGGRGGMDNQEDEDDQHHRIELSSSVEAERRLLLEMGWKEDDVDDKFYAPLTEDEVKEFKDLIMARNGFKTRNHTTTNTNLNHIHQINWSPKKANNNQMANAGTILNPVGTTVPNATANTINVPFRFNASPIDVEESSSSSDDDDDDNDVDF